MRRPSFPAAAPVALLAALACVACDAGSKPTTSGGPGPLLRIAAPRMDATFPMGRKIEKQPTKDKDGNDVKDKDGQVVTKDVEVDAPPQVEVLFDLMNYPIGKVADGGNGQHIHLIVDNEPYLAVYDATQSVVLDAKYLTKGTHVLRAFPSAGPGDANGAFEHESRKNAGAFAWVKFHVGSPGGDLATDLDPTKPMLTYSRPKGEYVVGTANQKSLMVDWYQTNVTLEKGGVHVTAWLDGTKLGDFVEWKPFVLPTAPGAGEHVVKLQLLDRDDHLVPGPFNSTERKFTVVEKK